MKNYQQSVENRIRKILFGPDSTLGALRNTWLAFKILTHFSDLVSIIQTCFGKILTHFSDLVSIIQTCFGKIYTHFQIFRPKWLKSTPHDKLYFRLKQFENHTL